MISDTINWCNIRGDRQMELKKIEYKLTVCKVADASDIDITADFYFVGKTDEEV